MKNFLCVIMLVLCTFTSKVSAQIFGPANYQDCILKGLESAKTESAVYLLQDACEKKFPEKRGDGLVTECNVTYNGERFIPGSPLDKGRYKAFRFSTTTSLVYFPEQMDPKLMKEIVQRRESEVRSICPGINFE